MRGIIEITVEGELAERFDAAFKRLAGVSKDRQGIAMVEALERLTPGAPEEGKS